MLTYNLSTDPKYILNFIEKNGGEARLVGGCVRDYLLGREIKDIDIATTLLPEDIKRIFTKEKIKVIPTGIDFGTVTVLYKNIPYEVTTLRSDINCDGRHAAVKFTTDFKIDSERRDFTFNALYMDNKGRIYDFHNGQEDLKKGIVRFIGNAEERIKEDYLRILRYFRFFARFSTGDYLESELAAVVKNKNGLKKISTERIRVEFLKTITQPQALKALKTMEEEGFLEILTGIKHFGIKHLLVNNNPILVLASILPLENFDNAVEKISERLKLSKKEKNFLQRLGASLKLDFSDKYQVNNSARINGKEEFLDYLILNYFKNNIESTLFTSLTNEILHLDIPDFPLKSADLIKLGYKGKALGEALRNAEEIWERSGYKMKANEILKGF
ncbi:MAG TPA: poly(A) polymerase [Alphaproteobacteria bacterium]|nr:poly(A) polymerase [Alphaproteobacteria bacterium]